MLWLAAVLLPLLVVAHAFDHGVEATSGSHGCISCLHGGHGGTLPAPETSLAVIDRPHFAVRRLLWTVADTGRNRPPVYRGRAPPRFSLS